MGMLKKAASGVPCLRRAYSAEVALATKAGSGYAQAGRHFAVLTYAMYALRVNTKVFPFRDKLSHSRPSLRVAQDRTGRTFLNIPSS